MYQTSRNTQNSSPTRLLNELMFQLKFDSFDLQTKLNELFTESNLELFSNWFGSLSAVFTTAAPSHTTIDSYRGRSSYIYKKKN